MSIEKLKCACGNNLFQITNDKAKLRTNIIVFEKAIDGTFSSQAVIKCPCCKRDNIVPVLLDNSNEKTKHIIFEK